MTDIYGQIADVKTIIKKMFVDQCSELKRVSELPDPYFACGQFLGLPIAQRGGHGVAAALSVLGSGGERNEEEVLCGLVEYLKRRIDIENELVQGGKGGEAYIKSAQDDLDNVIKVSETLYALRNIKAGIIETEAYRRSLAELLQRSKLNGGGWGYYMSNDSPKSLLPTAFAVQALSSYGIRDRESINYILDELSKISGVNGNIQAGVDMNTKVFALYVLSELTEALNHKEKENLKKVFRGYWRRLVRLFSDDIEQTIEYVGKDIHRYVRIPWQLYLIVAAEHFRAFGAMSSYSALRMIERIIYSYTHGDGFRYPQSGEYVSARTTAIVYDVFSTLQRKKKGVVVKILSAIDRFRIFIGSKYPRYFAVLCAIIISMIAVKDWSSTATDLGDVAPSLIASLLLLALASGKES